MGNIGSHVDLPLGGGDIKQYRCRQWHSTHPPRGQAPVKDGHLYGCWCQGDFAPVMQVAYPRRANRLAASAKVT
jgi:hypothetical protein